MWQVVLDEFRRNFRVVDGLDILVIAVAIYAGLVWFRASASRRLMIGISGLGALYLLARTFSMYLTSMLFHGFFAVVLVALVVVFQEDIRRMFERLATWDALAEAGGPEAGSFWTETVVEAAFALSAKKVGALFVLKGSEPLDRHTEGGIPLSGRVSMPLLASIFDPHSAGHDGAAPIDQGRIEKFGVHLPISRNRRQIGPRGTRHTAGLGLSECSDALVIVVSEERGTVSVAEGGRIQEVSNGTALKDRMERFAQRVTPGPREPAWKRALKRHARLKALSLALACVAWFVFAYNPGTIQRTFVAPIEYRNIPSELKLGPYAPNEARVTLSGSETAFRFLDPMTLKIAIDLGQAGPGHRSVDILDRHMRIPAKLDVYRIDPPTLHLLLEAVAPTGPKPPK